MKPLEDIKRLIVEKGGSMIGEGEDGFACELDLPGSHVKLRLIVSNGRGWEHVSVTRTGEPLTPTWEQMCYVKSICFFEDEWVVQYHPGKLDYVNYHPYCLHLWKPRTKALPRPDKDLIAPFYGESGLRKRLSRPGKVKKNERDNY